MPTPKRQVQGFKCWDENGNLLMDPTKTPMRLLGSFEYVPSPGASVTIKNENFYGHTPFLMYQSIKFYEFRSVPSTGVLPYTYKSYSPVITVVSDDTITISCRSDAEVGWGGTVFYGVV